MGFFEKVKNMFTEEVEEEVKVEQVKREEPRVTVEPIDTEPVKLENTIEEEPTYSKTVFFDDNDFEDLKLNKKEEPVKSFEREYGIRTDYKKEEEKKVFKPTPIISPVYGILDKNYHKEDIVSKNDVIRPKEEKLSKIDTIRNKAYGTLEDELENTLFGNNSILFKQIEEPEAIEEIERIDENVLSDLTEDIGKELDELLEKKEKYLDKENEKTEVTDDLLDFIDSTLYKNGDDEQ